MDQPIIQLNAIQAIVSIILALIASSGFWTWANNKKDKRNLQTQLLIGLAHDRIIYLGMAYIVRGWITQDEHENLLEYLFKPYEQLGGNGSAKRIMEEINKLPIRPNVLYDKGETKTDEHKTQPQQ